MARQVVVIHGGRTFDRYEEYLDSLLTRPVEAAMFRAQSDWRQALQDDLGDGYEVFCPKMPNSNNAVFKEWCIWFNRLTEFLSDDLVIVGHSLGGIFLAKYLSEMEFQKRVRAVILLAAPFGDMRQEGVCGFGLAESLQGLGRQAQKVYLVYSKDDPVVPYQHAARYQAALPRANLITFEDKQHFNQDSFPEMAQLIRDIFKKAQQP